MKGISRVVIAMTAINMVVLIYVIAQGSRVAAQDVAPVVRARALEIVDAQGRPRATISLQPSVRTNTGTVPETILFRLIDSNGRPVVKLGGADTEAGLGLLGTGQNYLLLKADDTPAIRVTTGDGKTRALTWER